nr:Uncharacterised protein [Klebsiella pneumoniae]
MLAGETAVIRRMPVPAGDDGLAARRAPVDKRIGYVDGTVAFRNRQRAAGKSRSANQPVTALDVPYVLLKPRRGEFATQILLHRRANGVNVQLLAKQIV